MWKAHVVKRIAIIMVDDDEDDRMLFEDAVQASKENIKDTQFSIDGVDLLERLRGEGAYADKGDVKLPDLIILDLNMPRMNGYEVLEELGNDKLFDNIPVVVMSTSGAECDVQRCYSLGASGFIIKPDSYEGVVETVKSLTEYWSTTMTVPARTA